MKYYGNYLTLGGIVIFYLAALLTAWGMGSLVWHILRLISGLLFFAAMANAIMSRKTTPENKKVVNVFLLVLVYCAMISFPNFVSTYGLQGFRSGLAADFVAYAMLSIGVTMLYMTHEELVRFIKVILIASLTLFILLIPKFDPTWVGYAATRNVALMELQEDRSAYHFQMGLATVFIALFLSIGAFPVRKILRSAVIFSLSFVAIVALYYSKRATLLDLAIGIALFMVFHGLLSRKYAGVNKLKIFAILASLAVVFFLSLSFFSDYSEIVLTRVFERFDELAEPSTIFEHPRIMEAIIWWDHIPPYQKLLGAGSLHYFISPVTGTYTHTLHMGWMTLFLKGGFVLVFFVGWMLIRNFFQALKCRNYPSFLVGTTLPVLMGISLIHSTLFGSFFSNFSLMLAIFLFPALRAIEKRSFANSRL